MEQRVIVSYLDTARLTCPECGRVKILQLSEYGLVKRLTRVKYTCKCKNTFWAALQMQPGTDKTACLAGTFCAMGDSRCAGKMVIKRLNSEGMILKTNLDQNILNQSILPGIGLRVEFVLDDAKQSVVTREIRVLARNGRYLTAEFTSKEHLDNLGPYLFSHKL